MIPVQVGGYAVDSMCVEPAPRDLIARLMDGYLSTQLLSIAALLGVADLLDDGPRSSGELAELTSTVPAVLHRVLRGLTVDGVLDEDAAGRFGLTAAGRCLLSGGPDSMRGAVIARGELYYEAAGALIDTVRDGGSAFRHAHGVDFFDAMAGSPGGAAAFQASMTARSRAEARDIVEAYDFGRFTHIVDVGGGHGLLLTAILRANPHLRGTLFDRPEAIAGALAAFKASGAAWPCTLVAGDFFASVPTGGDLFLLSRVVHDWDDAAAIRILTSCRQAMSGTATLLLAESVLPARARDLPAAIRMDLHMLTLCEGRERTLPEFDDLFRTSGFRLRRAIPASAATGLTLLEAQACGQDC